MSNKNDVLMIMNPRRIQKVIDSIKPLTIDKAWFHGYLERELEDVMNDFVKNTKYDNYILTSDDLIINKKAFRIIRNNDHNYDVLTGYCNLYTDSKEVNICLDPITLANKKFPKESDYNFCTVEEIMKQENDFFRTYLSGFSITSIKRDVWLDIPFQTYHRTRKGESSDHNFSYRALKSGVEMYSHKDTFSLHVKTKRNSPLMSEWIVGVDKKEVILEYV